MAQQTTLTVTTAWTLLTDSDVTDITFQNQGNYPLLIKGTVGAVAPSDDTGSITYWKWQGELSAALVDLFPGVAATRVYARFRVAQGPVSVGHA